jgi:hypothetical protein
MSKESVKETEGGNNICYWCDKPIETNQPHFKEDSELIHFHCACEKDDMEYLNNSF